ncbi:antibiotic biosynthesis monooxygenase [Flavobacteriaceae bacterium GSB9]|nr:antibiotic biosynthesis monooxygenase [Flavobacteriaceae bacterium GSB9]
MKTNKSLAVILILAASIFVLVGWYPLKNESGINSGQNVIVLLKFKAQPDKGGHAVSALINLFEKVKEEPNFISIKLHVDPTDNTNILLYEEWKDQDYYNTEHMNTAHLQEFMANSKNFIAGPPEITFWEVKNIVK